MNKAEFGWVWVSKHKDPEKETDNSTSVYTEELVDEIKDAGFNFVRLVIDDRFIFTEEDKNNFEHAGHEFYGSIDTINMTQLTNLDQMIEWCILNGIHVCIDCHSTPGGLMIGGDEEYTREPLFTENSQEQQIFKKYWEIIANRYADVDTRALSFNLYNEPPAFISENQDVYINLMNEATAIVEKASPDRLIFIDTLDYATRGFDHPEKLIVDECLEKNVSWCQYAFSSNIFSLVLYSEDDDFTTAGVECDLTPAGHRINRELANIITVK